MPPLIDTKAKRDRLAKRREPYWYKLILGGFIGYRVGALGGSWIARYRDEEGKQHYKSLDFPAHLAVNEFDCAVGEAKEWFDNQQQGFRARPGTVQEAADNYTEYLEQKKGKSSAKDAEGRIKLHILPLFAERMVIVLDEEPIPLPQGVPNIIKHAYQRTWILSTSNLKNISTDEKKLENLFKEQSY